MEIIVSMEEKEDTEKIMSFISSLNREEQKSFIDFIHGFELARNSNYGENK